MEMLRENLRQLEHVLDALNCGAALLDRAGLFVHVNKRLLRMVGRTRDEMVGRNVREFYTRPEEMAYIETALARSDDERDAEFVLPLADGSRMPVLTAARPLPPPLDHLHVVTIVDITAQKEAENGLKDHLAALTQVGDNAIEHAIELKDYSEELERQVQERTKDLRQANIDAIYMLAVASEAKDTDTGRHVRRIQRYAEGLSKKLGLSSKESHDVGLAAILHDVGKIHVPDQILKKPGPLDEDERFLMQQHTLYGERILAKRPFFKRARKIARSHHENWDGSGYPDRLAGEAIPLEARIVRVVDVYDALISVRVYKPAWSIQQAADLFSASEGTLFDPKLAMVFRAMIDSGEVQQMAENASVANDM